jgi:ketosteroid isomerase-like protein
VPAGSGARPRADRAADVGGIEKLYQHDLDATLSLDPVALTEMWTDDAVRLGPVPPAEVGKQAIREGNERLTANKAAKVLSYVPDHREMIFLDGGWEVEWRPYAASFVASPGAAPVQLRGMVLGVHKKMPDGTWKGFRGAGFLY